MENIDNMGKNSLEALARDNLTKDGKKRLTRDIVSGTVSLCFIAVGLICSAVFPDKATVPALLYTAAFLIEGIPVFVAAIRGIFTRDLTNAMEILVAIAITACFFSRELILASLIPLILNIAHILEERSVMGGREVIDGLRRMQQDSAVLLEDNDDGTVTERTVDARTLHPGQKIIVKAGVGISIDGIVLEGETHVDQKSLTGEPEPAHVVPGDKVYAGTVNIDGVITVEVEKEYVDTSFSNVLALLEKSESISVPESRLIDRFMRYYIPFILAVAAACALVTSDISKAIAILVVSCPCGQMLVSSAPMIAALSAAAKRGILIKNSKFIEEMTEIDAVVFDKTGTLTAGELSLTHVIPFGDTSRDDLLSAAASLSASSNHPVSRAVTAAAGKVVPATSVREVSGKGVAGELDGNAVCFGRREWFEEMGVQIPADLVPDVSGTVSFVQKNGILLGALGFCDTVRPEAKDGLSQLSDMGIIRSVMLTGDRESSARPICDSIGVSELHAGLLPEDKLTHLKKIRENSCVLAVGDGINDALALREADVGIAMGAMGSDLAIKSADIALMNNNLLNIPFVLRLSRRTRRIVYQNLALSIGISAIMISLSAFGVITALAGAILHNVGAFAVLINSSRLLRTE